MNRAAMIFDSMSNSTSAYSMCGVEPTRKDEWEFLGALWAVANPKKGGDEKKYQAAVELQQKLGPFTRSTRLFGMFVIGTKALSSSLSRPSVSHAEFCDMLRCDPSLEQKVENMRSEAIKVNKL